jgi:hypothetical protein
LYIIETDELENFVLGMKAKREDTASGANGPLAKFSKARTIANRLGVCPRTIFRWADSGKITRHKINARVVLFDEAEITALIRAARIETHHWSPTPRVLLEAGRGFESVHPASFKNR